MKYKTPMFDENNKHLRELLDAKNISSGQGQSIFNVNVLAKDICFKYGLKVLGAVHTKEESWGNGVIIDRPFKEDETKDSLFEDTQDRQSLRGCDNPLGYIVGKNNLPIGFITTYYSARYACEQFVYSHLHIMNQIATANQIKSKSKATLLRKIDRFWLNSVDIEETQDRAVRIFSGGTIVDRVVSNLGKPTEIENKINRLYADRSSKEFEPIEIVKVMAQHVVTKSEIPIKLKEELERLVKENGVLELELKNMKQRTDDILKKPVYVLAYNNNLPNLYSISKLNVGVDEKTNKANYQPLMMTEVFLNDISNSKFSEILKSKLTMWLASRENIYEEDNTTNAHRYGKCQGSIYHMRKDSNYRSDDDEGIYDEALGVHAISYKPSRTCNLITMEYLIFQNVD